MQCVFFAIALVIFSIEGYAQVYRPFPEGEAIWTISSSHEITSPPNPEFATYSSYIIQNGDTIINGTTYHKIYRVPYYDPAIAQSAYVFADTGYLGAIRQNVSVKQVYIFLRDDSTERLLYDFSNDSIGSVFPNTIQRPDTDTKLVKIDTVWLLSPNGFALYYLYNDDSVIDLGQPLGASLLEGVGGIGGGLITKAGLFNAPGTSNYSLFEVIVCMSEGNDLIFHLNKDTLSVPSDTECVLFSTVGISSLEPNYHFQVTPNPVSDYLFITSDVPSLNHKCFLTTYNLLGEPISSKSLNQNNTILHCTDWQPGIYIWQVIDETGSKFAQGKIVKE